MPEHRVLLSFLEIELMVNMDLLVIEPPSSLILFLKSHYKKEMFTDFEGIKETVSNEVAADGLSSAVDPRIWSILRHCSDTNGSLIESDPMG
ncbi:hypothetical protein FXO38_27665 [Capsicum annuum]|nr:hypothetical protein FXO37_33437 [Capsicum annuum]KAF3629468.1 hypothetical protein FXO38_27665 [Capsicum annuum]